MEVETNATVRCPADKREFITSAVCRLFPQTQFEQDQLLFHGTADPDSPVFPTDEQDNLRWYAFAPDMSLDFVREETGIRRKKGMESVAVLHVYRIRKPIRNVLLFADAKQWASLGGMEKHMRKGICSVKKEDEDTNRTLASRAASLGAPFMEYMRARGIQQYRVVRGERGEHINGWVRVNAIGIYEGAKLASKGFEFLLTCPDHEEYLELVRSYDVVDDSSKFGSTSVSHEHNNPMLWFSSAISPSPPSKKTKRRLSEGEQ